ncbi:DUF6636 domain-containing protein [Nocardia sp. NBC_00511]|uniref:DUF6636 domain-containing protein n=1 Tax=Nocardia sp. NBC_00511 TaxID=2903591 RepID=UPI0030E38C3C
MKAWVLTIALVAAIGGVTGCSSSTTNGASTPSGPVTTGAAGNSGGAGQGSAPATAPGKGVPTTTTAATTAVDARDYQQGDAFYFQSPTGNIMCGFINADSLGTGCQLEHASVVPASLPGCGTAANRAVAAEINGGTASFRCVSQGFYVGAPPNGQSGKGGGKVLAYGQTITVRGVACTSSQDGVRCDAAGHGFLIAADKQSLF